jgi:putative endonuclease
MIYPEAQQEQYFLYILSCSDNSYYIGLTNDLLNRLSEHDEGVYLKCHTFNAARVSLEYFETIPFLKEAIGRETQLKKWSRQKKEALI